MGCIAREIRNPFSHLTDEGTGRHASFEECHGIVPWGKRLRNPEKLQWGDWVFLRKAKCGNWLFPRKVECGRWVFPVKA